MIALAMHSPRNPRCAPTCRRTAATWRLWALRMDTCHCASRCGGGGGSGPGCALGRAPHAARGMLRGSSCLATVLRSGTVQLVLFCEFAPSSPASSPALTPLAPLPPLLHKQGACSTCASSSATLKMGIERALRGAFGDELKGLIQVRAGEKGPVAACSRRRASCGWLAAGV